MCKKGKNEYFLGYYFYNIMESNKKSTNRVKSFDITDNLLNLYMDNDKLGPVEKMLYTDKISLPCTKASYRNIISFFESMFVKNYNNMNLHYENSKFQIMFYVQSNTFMCSRYVDNDMVSDEKNKMPTNDDIKNIIAFILTTFNTTV